jgi:ribosomal protein L7/L12
MNTSRITDLINKYEVIMCMVPYNASQRAELTDLIKFGIRIGLIAEVEQRNPYTFGGVTISLTDTELATLMRLISGSQKITAIKMLRIDVSDKGLTLKEAKDFVDHLDIILKKSRA